MDNKKKQNTEALSKKENTTEVVNASQTAENAPQDDMKNEEQMMRRQSAPRPTAESEAEKMYQRQQMQMMPGFPAPMLQAARPTKPRPAIRPLEK